MADDGKDSSRSAILMVQAGLCLSVLGAAAVGLWWLRLEALPAYEQRLAHEQLLAQADQARGTQALREYHDGEWIRVREFAPAKTSNGAWIGVEEDSILVTHSAQAADARDGWLFANQLGESAAHPLMVHASFVERYDPLVLEHGLELSNCRPVRRYETDGSVHYSVSGQLRNGADRMISQCEVICQLHDSAGQSMVELKSSPMAIRPGEFAQFETSQAGENVGIMAFSMRVRYLMGGKTEESSQVLVSPRTPQETPR